MIKQLQQAKLKGKKVALRLDLDVPVSFGKVTDLTRLQAALPTLKYLIDHQATVIILGHAGRPNGNIDEQLSLRPMLAQLIQMFDQHYTYEIIDRPMAPLEGTIFALENIRFHPEEEANDPQFAKYLASFADIYVNDAFAVAHRAHASTEGITHFLPSYAGLHLQQEVQQLQSAISNPNHPVVAVLGGAKIETKLPVINHIAPLVDHVLLGGKLVLELDQIDLPSNVVTPTDMNQTFDIGPQTIEKYQQIISQAKTIIWNGPMGKFEEPPFDQGTRAVAQAIANNQDAFRISGGGDSIAAIQAFQLKSSIGHLSTAGGAMLDFLSGQDLPGLTALGYKQSAEANHD